MIVEVHGLVRADLELVDALARLRVAAQRAGGSVKLRNAPRELQELLVLAGLDEVLPLCERAPLALLRAQRLVAEGLALERRRQAEKWEQPGINEIGDPTDPAA